MYKEIIIIVLIVILILVGNVITQNYTKDTVKIIQENLNDIKEELDKRAEINNVEEKLDKTIQEWKSRNNNLAYYLEHDELEKIESELTALNANVLTNDYNQGRENLDRCYFLLEHIKEKETIRLSNIF